MSSGVKKTNAMRMLDSAKIPYEVRTYEFEETDLAGIHAAKFVVAADGTVAHCFGASFLFCPAPSRVHKADSLASISEFFRL